MYLFLCIINPKTIINNLKKFIEDLPLLIIDNEYTNNYLEGIKIGSYKRC